MDLRWLIFLVAVVGFIIGVVTVLGIQWYAIYQERRKMPSVAVKRDISGSIKRLNPDAPLLISLMAHKENIDGYIKRRQDEFYK